MPECRHVCIITLFCKISNERFQKNYIKGWSFDTYINKFKNANVMLKVISVYTLHNNSARKRENLKGTALFEFQLGTCYNSQSTGSIWKRIQNARIYHVNYFYAHAQCLLVFHLLYTLNIGCNYTNYTVFKSRDTKLWTHTIGSNIYGITTFFPN